jgi:regulator of RNase E activity RraA
MENIHVSDDTLKLLAKSSSATISTQLIRRGLRNVAIRGVLPLRQDMPPMVGPAFTLRYVPAREDLDAYGSGGDPANLQRQAIEVIPEGHIFVIDCRGATDIAGIGSILGRRLVTRGIKGVVLDGGVRDTKSFQTIDLPVYCAGPSVPPNYAGHHAADMNVIVACGGVAVYPGDIIFGDSEAVVVIPRHLAAEVATDAAEQERRERFLFKEIERGRSIQGVYPPDEETLQRYQAACKSGEAV